MIAGSQSNDGDGGERVCISRSFAVCVCASVIYRREKYKQKRVNWIARPNDRESSAELAVLSSYFLLHSYSSVDLFQPACLLARSLAKCKCSCNERTNIGEKNKTVTNSSLNIGSTKISLDLCSRCSHWTSFPEKRATNNDIFFSDATSNVCLFSVFSIILQRCQ